MYNVSNVIIKIWQTRNYGFDLPLGCRHRSEHTSNKMSLCPVMINVMKCPIKMECDVYKNFLKVLMENEL